MTGGERLVRALRRWRRVVPVRGGWQPPRWRVALLVLTALASVFAALAQVLREWHWP